MNRLDSHMKRAIVTLAILMASFTCAGAYSEPALYPTNIVAISLAADVLFSVLSVYLLRIVRAEYPSVGVFGYCWRVLLLRFLCGLFAILASMLFLNRRTLPSVAFTVYLHIVSFVLLPIAAWLLFSKSRRSQFKWVLYTFSGHANIAKK
jgi:hypothetical protein